MAARAEQGTMDPIERAKAIVLAILVVEVVVLAVTGVALYFVYRPAANIFAWNDIRLLDEGPRVGHIVRAVHLNVARLAGPTVLVAAALTALVRSGRRRWAGAVVGVAMALVAAAAFTTGYLLPWDQLALWAVTVGDNYRGYEAIRDGSVRFVLVGGAEVAPGTVIRWLLLHAALGGPVLGLLVAMAWRRRRSGRLDGPEPSADPQPEQTTPVEAGAGRAP